MENNKPTEEATVRERKSMIGTLCRADNMIMDRIEEVQNV